MSLVTIININNSIHELSVIVFFRNRRQLFTAGHMTRVQGLSVCDETVYIILTVMQGVVNNETVQCNVQCNNYSIISTT